MSFAGKKLSTAVLAFVLFLFLGTSAQASEERAVLKVCADPHYMPFSSENQDGFENKLAEIIANELGIGIEYTWFPQSMGFIRNTLRKRSETDPGYRCDIVMGVPAGYELANTTKPYFTSVYSLVVNNAGPLKDVQRMEDLLALPSDVIDDAKIGLTERSPGALWMAKHKLFVQMAPYIAQVGDPTLFINQEIYEDLSAGNIDGAIVWGPVAGYFTKLDQNLRLIPMESSPEIKLDYSISAGVRRREDDWRDQVDTIFQKNADQIQALLQEYNIPTVN
ncbi:MAG: quinoprotein dehydrogenase-associated putative ABC transporter substrate-binding protein [Acidiferrobacterales bacterium]|nr:quinoprotein dehydrogenase-associated putative ABC transporter substrate-binding protein [Acidiferrobacterales bacterium]